MESIAISGTPRTGTGSKAAKAARREGLVPCVIYGKNEQVVHFNTTPKEVKALVYSPDFKEVNITVDGQDYKCILKDLQFHPVSDALMHMDFLKLIPGNIVKVNIPVRCVGTSPGVVGGGRLTQKLRAVKVKTTSENLVGELQADISELLLGQSVRVKDIKLADGMEMMTSLGIPVASVETPRVLKSLDEEAAELAEAAEGGEGGEGAEGGDAPAEDKKEG